MLHREGGRKGAVAVMGLALAGISAAQAASPAAEAPVSLDTIVVLGSGHKVSTFDNPASVSVVGPETLRRTPAANVAELLRDVPGVQIFDNGSPGMQRIRIRGEDSRRVTIKIDGHALTDHSPHGTPLLIAPSTIERIEVVRGPSSVLSGSNAIGGVVNIITRRGGELPVEGSITATGRTATRGGGASATLQGANGDLDWRVSAGLSDDGDRRAADGRLTSTEYSHDQFSTHLGYRLDNHYLAFKADQYRVDADVYSPPKEGFESLFVSLPKRDLRKVGLFYEGEDLSPLINGLEASLYYQTIDRLFESGARRNNGMAVETTSDDQQTTYGLDIQAELDLVTAGKTLAGLEYEHDALDTRKTSSVFLPFPPPFGQQRDSATRDEAHIETFSAYFQQAWALNEATTLYLGARGYSVRAKLDDSADKSLQGNSDERLLGSLSLVHQPSDHWSLRANLAQGYSYPTLEQLFLTTRVDVLTEGNPDLSPESADTLELGTRYDGEQFMLDATLFYTRAEDYIGYEDLPDGPGPERRFVNINEARTTGVELAVEYSLPSWDATTLYLNGSLLRRELDYGTRTTTDSGTPSLAGNVGVRHEWSLSPATLAEADVFVRGESQAKLRDAAGEISSEAAGYGTLNAYLGLRHGANFDLGLSLWNLLDKSYEPYGEIPGAERSASLTGTFYF